MKPTPLTLKKKIALELWRQREALVRQEHPLRQLFWECTLRCDLKCRHCGSDCKMLPPSHSPLHAGRNVVGDMPREDFLLSGWHHRRLRHGRRFHCRLCQYPGRLYPGEHL